MNEPLSRNPIAWLAAGVFVVVLWLTALAAMGAEYRRADWLHWIDADGDCQDTRQEVLFRDAQTGTVVWSEDGCRVLRGQWTDPYTGIAVTDPAELDVDQVLSLAEAHAAGGSRWTRAAKTAYANDLTTPFHLRAVDAVANRAKGSRGEAEWLPPLYTARCRYVVERLAIRGLYGLTLAAGDRIAILRVLGGCA